uniref:Putative secreted protein n=1 Tax=Anopheles marajoara TaxID=58244 RepID=A0A2M4CA30_9DIPT
MRQCAVISLLFALLQKPKGLQKGPVINDRILISSITHTRPWCERLKIKATPQPRPTNEFRQQWRSLCNIWQAARIENHPVAIEAAGVV